MSKVRKHITRPVPVLVSVYNRELHFRKCIAALEANSIASETKLYVVSDGPSKYQHAEAIDNIRRFVRNLKGFADVELIAHADNLGGFKSGQIARDRVFGEHDAAIMLEDDVVVSPNFLSFINRGLQAYRKNKRIFAVCGNTLPVRIPGNYSKDVFFWTRFNPWGFGVWRDRWEAIDFGSGVVDEVVSNADLMARFAWDAPHVPSILTEFRRQGRIAGDAWICLHMFLHKQLAVYPSRSLTVNIGFDGSGENCGIDDRMMSIGLNDWGKRDVKFPLIPTLNTDIMIAFHEYFSEKKTGSPRGEVRKLVVLKRLLADMFRTNQVKYRKA